MLYVQTTILKVLCKSLPGICSLVNLVLCFFLLAGCTKKSSAHSRIYLLDIGLNTNSTIVDNLLDAERTEIDARVRTGYLASCIEFSNETVCGYTSALMSKYSSRLPELTLYNEGSNTTTDGVNLGSVSKKFQSQIGNSGSVISVCALIFDSVWLVCSAATVLLRWTQWKKWGCLVTTVFATASAILAAIVLCYTEAIARSGSFYVDAISLGLLSTGSSNDAVAKNIARSLMSLAVVGWLCESIRTWTEWKRSAKEC